MPLYEINERFTKSDLVILGWRSQELSYLMDRQMKKGNAAAGPPVDPYGKPHEGIPLNLPEKFFNEDGELDLRRVTGAEALKFMRMQGVNVPFVPMDAHRWQEHEAQKKKGGDVQ